MPNTRRLRPVLRVGQQTSQSHEFRLVDTDGDPIDVTGADVSFTMEHDRYAYTAVEGGDATIVDGANGVVAYEFSASETSLHGRYRVQFEVDYGGATELVPPADDTWVLDVGRRIPDPQPLSVPRVSAEEATFGSLQATTVDIEQATISQVVGDPDISDLSIDSLDVTELAGGIVGSRGPLVRLDGPDLYIDENGELAWQNPTEGGFTEGSDHDHSETGSGGDTLRPAIVGTTDSPVEDATINTAVVAEELALPEYDDVTTAPQTPNRVIYATGNGASPEGIYRYNGDAYTRVLANGEDFDGQGTSSFQNLESVGVDDARAGRAEIDANRSVAVGSCDDIEPSVIADDGTLYGILRDSDTVVTSENIRDGYEVVNDSAGLGTVSHERELHLTANGTLLIGSNGSIYRSTDGGQSWTAVQSLSEGPACRSISENTNGDIIAAEYDGDPYLWQSSDDGQTWTLIADWNDFPEAGRHLHRARYAPSNPDWIVLTYGDNTAEGGYYRSTDNGQTWDHYRPTFPTGFTGNDVTFYPDNENIYFIGGTGMYSGIIKIYDDGSSVELIGHQQMTSTWSDRGGNDAAYQLSTVMKPDGSHYFIGATAGEQAVQSHHDSQSMIFASDGGEGRRWRMVERIEGRGWRNVARSQGPNESIIDIETAPYIPSRNTVISLYDMDNPLYGSYLRTSFGPGDIINTQDRILFDGRYDVRGDEYPSFRIDDVEFGKLMEIGKLRGLRIGANTDLPTTELHTNLDLEGNIVFGNGADSETFFHGWHRFRPQAPSNAPATPEARIIYFDSDPDGGSRGAGWYIGEGEGWGKIQANFTS